MVSEDRAWAAGFFDGEGSTSATSAGRLLLSIAQKHREPLDRFTQVVGYGTVRGPYPDGMYRLQLSGLAKIQHALGHLWPWLGTAKREQAREAVIRWTQHPRSRIHTSRL